MSSVRRSTTSGVPRPLVLRPLGQDNHTGAGSVEDLSRRQRPTTSSSGATESTIDPHSMLSSPKNLIEKYGFRITMPSSSNEISTIGDSDWSHGRNHFHEPDHLRTLAIVALGEGVSDEDDQCAFINKQYLAVWNPTVANNLLTEKRLLVEEVAFPGPKSNLDALLRCIWPSDHWPLSIAQLKEAIGPCCDWGMHPSLVSTISYYLHNNPIVTVIEKLKLSSRCGNPLLLLGALRYQCRRETIFDIVNRSPIDYQHIVEGAHAAMVAGKMLEHAAREGDEEYKEQLIGQVKEETSKFRELCSQLIDFALPETPDVDQQRPKSASGSGESDVLTECCLVVSSSAPIGSTPSNEPGYFHVNRAYLSCWSPVFHTMFYGDFADRRRQRISLEVGDGEQPYWRLFLTLIHPSYMCALWRLLPTEYCYSSTGRGVTNLNREWIDEAFAIIFDQGGVEALMQVFRLAHKFQVLPLVDFCVLMIEAKSGLTLADKIILADTYHLPTLMAWCIGKLTTARSVKRMFSENEQLLSSLSCSSHKILLERMLELV